MALQFAFVAHSSSNGRKLVERPLTGRSSARLRRQPNCRTNSKQQPAGCSFNQMQITLQDFQTFFLFFSRPPKLGWLSCSTIAVSKAKCCIWLGHANKPQLANWIAHFSQVQLVAKSWLGTAQIGANHGEQTCSIGPILGSIEANFQLAVSVAAESSLLGLT